MGVNALKKLGECIRVERSRLGMSQEALAEAAGLHRTYIGGVERGERNIGFLNLVKIAEALHTTPAELLSMQRPRGGR